MKFILLSCLCLPIAAQVQWLSSSSPSATNPVYGTAEKSRVCRVSQGGNNYAGLERLGVCDTVQAGVAQGTTNYEVAVGLGKWEASGLAGAATLGNIAGLPARVCRFQSGSNMVVGYTEGNPAVCRGAASGSAASNNKFEVLYDFTTSGDFHILQNGLCVSAVTTQNSPSQATPPVVLRACSGLNLLSDRWKLQVSGNGLKLESGLFAGQCLRSASVVLLAGVATQPGVELVACASAPVLNFEWFDDTTFRIRNPVSNEVMGRWKAGLQAGAPPMFKTADGGASEGFEVLTLNEASRRLSVVSYNTMCLPDDQFPLMKQDERAAAIPDQLNRLGALPDVMALQEGFKTSSRNALIENAARYGYLWSTGVPDWPDATYVADFLNPVNLITLYNFSIFTNGGAYVVSRWPIEQVVVKQYDSRASGFNFDSFSAKGVTYARIQKLGRRYHIFDTHTQSGPPSSQAAVRRAQLREMRAFANLMLLTASPDDGVVFTGDFNIDMELDVANYNDMLQTLVADFVNAPRPVGTGTSNLPRLYSVDPTQNTITLERGATKEWLDYTLIDRNYASVDRARYEVYQVKQESPFQIDVGVAASGPKFQTRDLSDHGALYSRFRFAPSATLIQPAETIQLTVNTLFQGQPIVSGLALVNGVTVTTPRVQEVVRNQSQDLGAFTYLPGPAGYRFIFDKWEKTPAQNFSFTPVQDENFIAFYRRQAQLKVDANPLGAGRIEGSNYYEAPATIQLNAIAEPGFTFTGYSGGITTTRNSWRYDFVRNEPVTIQANFASTGSPRLSLTTEGPRTDTSNGLRRLYMRMTNSGAGGAVNARVTGVQSITVVSGSGPVTLPAGQAMNFGAIAAGATSGVPGPLDFVWPATAARVRFVFLIEADGGYSTTATLTLIR